MTLRFTGRLLATATRAPRARLTPGQEEPGIAVMREIGTKVEAIVPGGIGSVHWR
ncbi:hypothetical protein ACIHFC_00725 [Streptomyces sp. NPDC052013]|uniref:hypothetical protein n=1 Tax=Streptomyces sp. NPDC052013 TaxID=3365679 RepID=UPI0037D2C0AB